MPREPPKAELVEGRIPPNDQPAEAAVLSAVMNDAGALDRISPPLAPEHFYSEAHRRIFEACVELHAQGTTPDQVFVGTWLRDRDRLAQVGGMAYIGSVLNAAPCLHGVEGYAATVLAKARLRRMIVAAQRIVAEGYAGVGDIDAFADRAESAFYAIARSTTSRPRGERVADVVARTFAQLEKQHQAGPGVLLGIPSGLVALDVATGGLHPGEHTILAARPGMGKTALAFGCARSVALRGLGVVFFSLEMPEEAVVTRALCGDAGVNIAAARTNRFGASDWSKVAAAAGELAKPRHFIIEDASVSLAEIRAIVRSRHAEMARDGVRLALVVVDYAQIVEAPAGLDARDHEHGLAHNARGLKRLAKETGAHVLTCSQLNRSLESRNDKRPMLSDLRESGALEEAADVAIGIYRDSYYSRASKRPKVAELLVMKQRQGPTGTIEVGFDAPTARFYDLEPDSTAGHTASCRCKACDPDDDEHSLIPPGYR